MKPIIACISPVSNISGLKENLESLGPVFYTESTDKNDVRSMIEDNRCNVIFVNPNKLNYKIDEHLLEGIKIVCTASTGTNHIDKNYCLDNNIEILSLTNEHKVIDSITSTAEHAFALALSLIRNIPSSFESVKNGDWDYLPFIGRQISNLNIGVVGLGRLGKLFAKYSKAFGANVFVCDPYIRESECRFIRYELESLFKVCDIVSLHVHVSEETRHMINKNIVSKPLYLINTSRGEIVDEEDIVEMLNDGRLLGYATDVIADEFGNVGNSKLIEESKKRNNLIITPHIGGMTIEAQKIAYNHAVKMLKEKIDE